MFLGQKTFISIFLDHRIILTFRFFANSIMTQYDIFLHFVKFKRECKGGSKSVSKFHAVISRLDCPCPSQAVAFCNMRVFPKIDEQNRNGTFGMIELMDEDMGTSMS